MEDRRRQIINAGLALLREDGLPGLTQPRIAARTGMRQSHLTYYYPTRAALLEAVARSAIEFQIAGVAALLSRASSIDAAAGMIAASVCEPENNRVLAALSQAADREPVVRELFGDLLRAFVAELASFLARLGLPAGEAEIDLVHSLFVGLSVVNLATGIAAAEPRACAVFGLAFELLQRRRGGAM